MCSVTQTRLAPKSYCFFCQYSSDEATVPCCSSEQSQYSILHFLQSQTLGWVVIKILFGFEGVPSNPTSFALAEVVGLFTIAKVSHNSGDGQAVMLVTGRCSALSNQQSAFSDTGTGIVRPLTDVDRRDLMGPGLAGPKQKSPYGSPRIPGAAFESVPTRTGFPGEWVFENAWGMNGRKQKENLKPDIERSGTRHDQSFGSNDGHGRLGESRGIRKQRKQPRGLESERTRSGRYEVHFLPWQ